MHQGWNTERLHRQGWEHRLLLILLWCLVPHLLIERLLFPEVTDLPLMSNLGRLTALPWSKWEGHVAQASPFMALHPL